MWSAPETWQQKTQLECIMVLPVSSFAKVGKEMYINRTLKVWENPSVGRNIMKNDLTVSDISQTELIMLRSNSFIKAEKCVRSLHLASRAII